MELISALREQFHESLKQLLLTEEEEVELFKQIIENMQEDLSFEIDKL